MKEEHYRIHDIDELLNKVYFKNSFDNISVLTVESYIDTLTTLGVLVKDTNDDFIQFKEHKENWNFR